MGILKWVAWERAREERKREREIRKNKAAKMYKQGYTVETMARELGVKPSTVKTYLRELKKEGKIQ